MKLDLTPQQLDLVLQGVQQLPWHLANPLINTLVAQANSQENQNADATSGNPEPQSEGSAG